MASFGHLLDGNLHLALQSHNFDPEMCGELDQTITDYVTGAGGAVSAELGCGFRNRSVRPRVSLGLILRSQLEKAEVGLRCGGEWLCKDR